MTCLELDPPQSANDETFENCVINDKNFDNKTYTSCVFKEVNFHGCLFKNAAHAPCKRALYGYNRTSNTPEYNESIMEWYI